jgi:DNA-binding transcriptional LysR family regulator
MELRQLEHFVAVAEEGHFNRAASRCHIVRSGLSASIRGLEREFGTPLFVRTTREVRLTAAGTALLSEARRTLAAAEKAREAVHEVGGLLRGTLSLGVTQANRAVDPPELLAMFHESYPAVAISVIRGTATDIFEKVTAGAIDVGLSYFPTRRPPNSFAEPLASGSTVFACSHQHAFADRIALRLSELRDETFINVPAAWARSIVDEAFDVAGLTHVSRLDVTGLETFLDLVRVGLAVAIVPGPDAGGPSDELVRKADLDERSIVGGHPPVCYVPIIDAPQWTYGMVTAPPELRTVAARAFVDILTNARRREPDIVEEATAPAS